MGQEGPVPKTSVHLVRDAESSQVKVNVVYLCLSRSDFSTSLELLEFSIDRH